MGTIETLSEPELPANLLAVAAAQKLEAYMAEDFEHSFLREHQVDVMQSLQASFARGETAGCISLPTAGGKSVLITEIASALDMKTLVVSPLQEILTQTADRFAKYTPEVLVTNYFSKSKNLEGKVINTTYQSLQNLIKTGSIDPAEFELIICDEAHTALGERRHTIFRNFPNALMVGLTATPYFAQLEEYQQRGIVDSSEQWTRMFTNEFHDMSFEEAIERNIIAPLDVHLVETSVRVGNVRVTGGGNYDVREIERYLTREGRDYLALSMLAGPDKLPAFIKFSDEQKAEIAEVHDKIKGKRTVIFGISIDHIESLKERLNEYGIAADTIHHKKEGREGILSTHQIGELQVVLSVEMLRLGWDSPATEVGIFLSPTRSGIVAKQELGRILRLSPQTGKNEAIAIQFVDMFDKATQAPILIPNLFDPSFILRGSQMGRERTVSSTTPVEAKKPVVTFSGMNIAAIIHEATSQELLRERFKNSTIEEMAHVISTIAVGIQKEHQGASTLELYQKIAEKLPARVSLEAQHVAIQAVASLDSRLAATGKEVFLFLNMKTVLTAIEPYMVDDSHENEDVVQAAIANFLEKFGKRDHRGSIALNIHGLAKSGAAEMIAKRESMPKTWVLKGVHKYIKEVVMGGIGTRNESYFDDVARSAEIGRKPLQHYIEYIRSQVETDTINKAQEAAMRRMQNRILAEDLDAALSTLSERQQKIIKIRFGLEDGIARTYEQTGKEFTLTSERIRQIETLSLSQLRHPSRSRPLEYHLEE